MGDALVPDDGLLVLPAMHLEGGVRLGRADLGAPEPECRRGERVPDPCSRMGRIPVRETVGVYGFAWELAQAIGADAAHEKAQAAAVENVDPPRLEEETVSAAPPFEDGPATSLLEALEQ